MGAPAAGEVVTLHATGEALATAAEQLIGIPFRLHGRNPETGLDCVGVVAAAVFVALWILAAWLLWQWLK